MILQNGKRIDGCSDTVPVGTLQPYLGLVPPKGYLVCQGQLVSKITYSKLYEICGDTFGTSTATHFYLPDLRGKTLAGYDENDTAMNTIGKLLGQKTHIHTTGNHTLTIAEMPAHTHNDGKNNEGITATTGGSTSAVMHWDSNSCELSTTSTGGGQAHNHGDTGSSTNYQPTITVNWIVKAVMLIPNYIIVENRLDSDSAVDALSARQGKLLNEKFADYATKSEMIQYLPLSGVINSLTSTSTTDALSAAQGKLLNEKFTDYATKSEMIQYLPLSGGTLTGAINMLNDQYYASTDSYALNLNNSDIIGLNSLYWQDICNDDTEGIHFIRTNNNTDTLRGYDGDLIWTPNHSKTASGTRYSILGTHNTKDYVVEQGTSGFWTYRKWSSGIAECWGQVNVTTYSADGNTRVLSGTSSDTYKTAYYQIDVSLPSGLFTSVNCVTATALDSGTGVSACCVESWDATTFRMVTWGAPDSCDNGQPCVHVFGRWK